MALVIQKGSRIRIFFFGKKREGGGPRRGNTIYTHSERDLKSVKSSSSNLLYKRVDQFTNYKWNLYITILS